MENFTLFVPVIIVFGIIISIFLSAKKNTRRYNNFDEIYDHRHYSHTASKTFTNQYFNIPNFNQETFKHYVEMVYSEYLNSINKKNTKNVNPFLSEVFAKTHQNYIDSLIQSNRNVHIENVSINEVVINNYITKNNNEIIEVFVESIMNSYETNDKGQILNGYRSRRVLRNEVLYFQRNTNSLFKGDSYKCPNCMGIIKNPDEPCEYCGTVVKHNDANNKDWLLADTKVQNSNPYNRY